MKFASPRFISTRLWQHLEPRILFDASPDADISTETTTGDLDSEPEVTIVHQQGEAQAVQAESSTAESADGVSRELVIVDASVENYPLLVDDLLGNEDPTRRFEVIVIGENEDGISRLTEILAGQSNLDGLHILSHGEDGAFRLGNTWVNETSLQANAGAISGWGDALNDGGDILLYGCDVASNQTGRDLVDGLAALTGQEVAASDDDTGAASRGGDWTLEYANGEIETQVAIREEARAEYAYVLAAGPTVSISADQDVMLGEAFTFNVTFDNTGSDTGFGPYIDLIFPVNGADGSAGTDTADGIDFNGATYLGQALTVFEFTFPDDGGGTGTIDHPFWVDGSGSPLQVTGTAGDKLVVVELPFGSVTAGQPEISVAISATMNGLADLGTPLTIQTRSGFRYGEDALDNPAVDPSILSDSVTDVTNPLLGWSETIQVTPTLMTLEKEYVGPENETATGPSYVRQYQISVDIANGQSISNLDIIDSLPNNIVVTNIDSVTVGGAAATYSDNLGSLTQPGNAQDLIVTLTNQVTGTTSTQDVVVTISFYVPEFDADGNRIIPINGEDDTTSTPDSRSLNNARAVGDWTPTDVRDTGGTDNAVADPDSVNPEHILDDKSIAIQKSVSVVGGGPVVPGAVLEYTFTFQISDYYTFGDLVIDDIFQDGQRFDFGFGATFQIGDFSNMAGGNFSVRSIGDADAGETLVVDETKIDLTDNASENPVSDGSTTLAFDVSQAFVNQLTADGASNIDGILQGGLSNGGTHLGSATGTITFRTVIQEDYADTFPSNDRSVDQGDTITNDTLTITGSVRQNAEDGSINTILLAAESDDSSAGVTIANGTLNKEVYAINGNTSLPMGTNGLPVLVAGDVVTYRITYTLPTSDFEDLILTDFLPLPIFEVSDHNADGTSGDTWTVDFGNTTLDAVSGTIELGANDDFFVESGITPTLSIDSASNQLTIDFGDYDDPTSGSNTIELYLNVTAQDSPTADGLFLTNLIRAQEGTTQLESNTLDQIIQIEVTQPVLNITKGIVGLTNPNGNLTGSLGPAGISFAAVGSVGSPFSGGNITSDGLASGAINANATGLDSGDRVRFALVIENTGNSAHGAFDVALSDSLPAGLSLVAGSLQVVDGTGSAIAFTGTEADLFTSGITLDDPNSTQGSLGQYNASSGDNIVILFYEAEVSSSIPADSSLTNTVSLTNFAGQEGGEDHTVTDLTESATLAVAAPTVSKTLTGTEIDNANNGATEVVIGEYVDYQIIVIVPEGQMTNFEISDVLDPGMVYLNGSAVITASAGLSTTETSFASVASTATVNAAGTNVTFDFGTLANSNTDDSVTEQITITLRAIVTNVDTNDTTTNDLNNQATVSYDSGPNVSNTSANVTVLEPNMTVTVSSDVSVADVGNPMEFTITISNVAGATGTDAYDVDLSDILPTGLTYVGASLTHDSGLAPTTFGESGGTITASWATFAKGSSATFTFLASANGSFSTDGVTNAADIAWTSLPGDETTARSTHSGVSTERTGDALNPGTTENDYVDSDNVSIAFPITPTKVILSTSEAHTTDSSADDAGDPRLLAIGEIVTYELRTAIGEGTLNSVIFRDLMTEGMTLVPGTVTFQIIADSNMTVDAALSGANSGVITLDASRITVSGTTTQQIDFDLGTLMNLDNDVGAEELVITFQAIVSNESTSSDGDVKTNQFEFIEGGTTRATSNTVYSQIVEPEITNVDKRVLSTNASGTEVTYEITFANSGNTSAFDVSVLDSMATELSLQTGTIAVTNTGTLSGINTTNSTASDLDIRISEMQAGSSITIQYTVTVAYIASPIQNDADVTYTSLPGAQGTANATPGASGDADGERNGSGTGENSYSDSESAFIGSISDHVFYDIGGDGIDNGSDVGIPGVSVNLVWFGVDGIEGNADDVSRTTTTDSSGNYIFTALPAGSFRVTVATGTLPNGITTPSYDLDGTGTASTILTTLTDSLSGIVRDDVDFGYTGSAQLGDTVYLDIDNNGTQDAGEMGLANVDIQLTWHGFDGSLGGGDDVTSTQTTDNDGGYNFALLPAGSFRVDLVNATAPAGTTVTTGNDTHVVTLTVGQDHNDSDFGLRGPGTIGDFVFFDSNNDGTYDVGIDSVFPGVTVTWTGDIDSDGIDETFSTTTDLSGAYSFVGLPLDSYTITVTPPSGTTGTYDATGAADNQSVTTLTVGTPDATNQDFGLTGSGTIGDIVFWDHDGNGAQNGSEIGLSGVTVQLQIDLNQDGSDEITLTTTTAADGSYSFGNLPPGAYTVVVTQPTGATPTVDADGLGTANASSVVLTAGQTRNDQDFGYNGTGSIGDLVFFDYVGDGGVFNAGEGDRGMGGVDVTLDVDINGDSVSDFTLTTTTAADGTYRFNNLVAGDYTITVDSSDLPDQMGANPTYDSNGTGTANTSTLTLGGGATNTLQDFGYHAVPDYNIVIDDGQLAANTGESLTYTVTIRNDGTLRGNNAVVTVSFPTNLLTSVSASTGGIVDTVNGTITWNATTSPALEVMNVGEQVVFTINANVVNQVDGSYQPITLTSSVTDDLTNGIDPNLSDNTNTDVDQIPEIGVAKRLVSSTAASISGNRNLTYELVVRNIGSIDLTDLSLFEDLNAQFGSAFQSVVTAPTITASTATADPNFAAWNGNSATDMFDSASGLLKPGEEFTIRFTIEVDIDQLGPGSNNQVQAAGDWDILGTESGTTNDLSDTGNDPLGNNPGNPGDSGGYDDPTLVPAIGIAKDHGDYSELLDSGSNPTGEFTFPTTLTIENLGATNLTGLNLRDNLATIYGDAFVRVENLTIVTTGVTGTAPTLNVGWMADTSENLLVSGLLLPGDTFTISFDVTLHPDSGGASGYFNNQAVITGSDPSNPTAVIQDYSDSGLDPGTNNIGDPGDTANADDPTPVAIPDIGLAKRIIDAKQKGLTFELTIELVLANTGTVDLHHIELRDDIADQYGANFGAILGTPVIVTSTATTDPTMNTAYSADTSQAIFDGTDGFLKPGESITIRLVVEVKSVPGQTEVTVINQATTFADPLDENGDPLEDNSGNPIARITDLSDSGADATGRNPGAPGDTGTWNDPTPQSLTFFTFDAFNDFSQGKKGLQQDDKRDSSDPYDESAGAGVYHDPGRYILTHKISQLAPEPIFSGSATSGNPSDWAGV